MRLWQKEMALRRKRVVELERKRTEAEELELMKVRQKEAEDEKLALRSRSSKSRTPFPRPPKFTDKLEEREYLKFRLAQAFRIFGHLGYDEGVAGHITVRVSYS